MKQIQTLDRKEQIKHPNDRKQIPLLFGRFGWQFQALLIWWDRPWCWLSYQNLIHEPYPRTIGPRRRKKTRPKGSRGSWSVEWAAFCFQCLLLLCSLRSTHCCVSIFTSLLPVNNWVDFNTFFRLFCSSKQHPKKAAHNRARVCVCVREDATKLIFPLCRVRSRGRTNLAGASSSVKLWSWRLNWCRCVSFPIDFWCFPHGLSAHHRGTLHHYLGGVNMGATPSGWS